VTGAPAWSSHRAARTGTTTTDGYAEAHRGLLAPPPSGLVTAGAMRGDPAPPLCPVLLDPIGGAS
jgi:hypothetical protein